MVEQVTHIDRVYKVLARLQERGSLCDQAGVGGRGVVARMRSLDVGDVKTVGVLNDDGRIYLTQTRHEGRYVIRVQVGQFDCTRADVMMIPQVVAELIGG